MKIIAQDLWQGVRGSLKYPSLALAAVLTLTFAAGASSGRRSAAPETMTVRNAHGMAYDSRRGRIVLFGGADAERVRADTWEWDGKRWIQVSTTGPPPRTFPSLAYDDARGVTLLFGGNRVLFGANAGDATFVNDLWQWDGVRWRQIQATGPAARAEAAMTYDSRRRRAVLFGGYYRVDGKLQRLGDTWEWDGERWIQVSTTGPAPRSGAAICYDRSRGKVVLFGGGIASGGAAETWEWDGREWRRIETAVTDGRFNAAMAYDEERGRVVRFGGWDGTGRTRDTWEYDGRTWALRSRTGPAARNHAAAAYDRRRKRVMLFGGHDGRMIFGDVWEWGGDRWVQRVFTAPLPRSDNGH